MGTCQAGGWRPVRTFRSLAARWTLAVLAVLAGTAAGCTGPAGPAGLPADADRLAAGGLRNAGPCPDQPGFTCASLPVPLDPAGLVPDRLDLRVALAGAAGAPRGVLLLLTGGPGQPGVPYLNRLRERLGSAVAGAYRMVAFDQRGTGAGALDCPALQAAEGSSDLLVPPPGAVEACAGSLGDKRGLYGTAQTVRDIEALRIALGVPKLTLDGISYGSFVAARYAIAYPSRVAALVLDSVVPHNGFNPLLPEVLRASGRVLADVCRARRCGTDPAADLATAIRGRASTGDPYGVEVLDALVALSIMDPGFNGVPQALHDAARGRPAALDQIIDRVLREERNTPAGQLSQGLHAATLCADLHMPWGGPDAPLAGRADAVRRAAAGLPDVDVRPFGVATAGGNGLVATCERWPRTAGGPLAAASMPAVPVLLLAGDRDLSTPLEWARSEAAAIPGAQLVVVAGAGHSVQSRATDDAGRLAARRFLTG